MQTLRVQLEVVNYDEEKFFSSKIFVVIFVITDQIYLQVSLLFFPLQNLQIYLTFLNKLQLNQLFYTVFLLHLKVLEVMGEGIPQETHSIKFQIVILRIFYLVAPKVCQSIKAMLFLGKMLHSFQVKQIFKLSCLQQSPLILFFIVFSWPYHQLMCLILPRGN